MMLNKGSSRSVQKHPVKEWYDAYQDGVLTASETVAYRQHLADCRHCADWSENQARLIDHLQIEAPAQIALSPAAAARIQQDVTKRMRRALMVSNIKSNLGAAAAVAILAVVVGIFIWNSRNLDGVEIAQPSVPEVDVAEDVASGEVSDELLIAAVLAADPAEVERLLIAGVSPELKDANGRTLVETAIVGSKISGDTEILELLVKHGADVKALENNVLFGRVSASAGIIEVLMESGTDVDRLLGLAAEGGLLESVQMLLEAGADPDSTMNITGPFAGNYPVIALAVFSNSPKMVELLIDNGADLNQGDGSLNRTALHTAAFLNHPEIAQLLIDNGADLNAKSSFKGGTTPLMFAIAGNSFPAAQVLIDAGADVDVQTSLGQTALMTVFEEAASGAVTRFATLLLDAGADPNIQDRIGNTALHYASEKGYVEAIPILLEHGADVSLENDQGETPLDLAATEEVAEILRQAGG